MGHYSPNYKYAIATITNCKETQRSICCETEIKEWIQQNGQTIRDNQKAILYFLSSTYKCNFLGADNKQ